ncbi:hypothetical protein C9374_013647 [Naegleria lovaniensis]|uniref:Ubiquitin-like domain-containing protein n=1 Tax=Naegleria lovaniensis TaxID=51637 RepID=A0AA88G663_NAELO|nr:uncharacterized protein C9374_013647 [Naegleria lovaniensis]KAG2372692.1 hypothetical protein C9374_013647 [Naegleria lovaniensis]
MTQHSPSSSTTTNTITKHKEPSFQAPTRNAIIKTVTGKFPITISDSTSIMEIKRAWAQHQGNSLDDETLNCMLRVVFNHRVWEGDYHVSDLLLNYSPPDDQKELEFHVVVSLRGG